jgi:hypothetical protein
LSDYTQVTFFTPKDALASGNPAKLIKGTEFDVELSAISDAIASKTDASDPIDADTFEGVALADLGGNATGNVGYLALPQTTVNANYTAVLADAGGIIRDTSGLATLTIPANASVAFPVGTTLTFINTGSGSTSVAITSDTLIMAGTISTGTRGLGINGLATAVKIASTVWIISGTGLS